MIPRPLTARTSCPPWKLLAIALALSLTGTACNSPQPVNPPIALLTDFGTRDPYVAQLKGAILSIQPHAHLIDLSHEIKAHDVRRASYFLDKAIRSFPPDAIIVAVVDPGVGGKRTPIALRTRAGRTYVGPDNGIFSHVILREKLAEARAIENKELFRTPEVSSTFHGRDIFGPVAAHLSLGLSLDAVGPVMKKLNLLPLTSATTLGDKVNGEITHVDQFGNILTNIPRDYLAQMPKDSLVKVTLAGKTTSLPIVNTYEAAPEKRPFLIINSDDEVEIAIKEGSAAQAIRVEVGQKIIIQR